jgi:dTDP-4-dehydrorhamnose reductase
MPRILVFGQGFLGTRLAAALGARLLPSDITDADELGCALPNNECGAGDVVINAAGKTGRPNVDWCEVHREETYLSNTVGPLRLAEACAKAGAYLVHLGSGCVFYGISPHFDEAWREEDPANPVSFYSRTKYAADLVLSRLPNACVARIRMPIDSAPHTRNLVTKLVGYREVVDVSNSVTVVDDLIEAIKKLIEKRAVGVFHVVNPGALRHRELLAMYRELVDPSHKCRFIEEHELVARGLADKPRSNAILASSRLKALGIHLRPVHDAVREALVEYAKAIRA